MLVWVALCWLLLWACRRRLASLAPRCSNNGRFRVQHLPFCVSIECLDANALLQRIFDPAVPWRRALLDGWFNLGVYFMGLGQLLSALLLLYFTTALLVGVLNRAEGGGGGQHVSGAASTSSSSSATSSASATAASIVPLIPGINLPAEYLLVFWFATFIALAVHELGHAAAAAMERLQILGFGVFFAFLFPGAYVRIEDSLQYIPMWSQLKVYAAGVWNNVLLTLTCILLVPTLPTLLSFGYVAGEGAVVARVTPGWGLEHVLDVGDVITALNGFHVRSSSQLLQHIQSVDASLNGFVLATNKLAALTDIWEAQRNIQASGSSIEFDVLQMPGYCTSYSTLERLSASINPHDPLECCTHAIAPWLVQENTAFSPQSCFVHWRGLGSSSNTAARNPMTSNQNSRKLSEQLDRAIGKQHLRSNNQAEPQPEPSGKTTALGSNSQHPSDGEAMRWWRNRHGQGDVAMPAQGENLKPSQGGSSSASAGLYCLSAKGVVNSRNPQDSSCETDADCNELLVGAESKRMCLRPLTTYPNSILTISLDSGATILFEGTGLELSKALEVTDMALRDWLDSLAFHSSFLTTNFLLFPSAMRTFLVLCAQISLSVAVLNMMPVQYFDGGHAFKQFARIMFPGQWRQLSDVTIKIANGLLIANLLSSILPLLLQAFQASAFGSALIDT